MPRKDVRFNAKYIKNTANDRKDDKVQGEEIGNGTIISKHIADGNITTSKIADNAVTPDKTNFNYLDVDSHRLFSSTASNTRADINPLWSVFKPKGNKLYTDECFASGNNSIAVYNNNGGTAVTHTRRNSGFIDTDASSPPNSSGYVIEIKHAPTTSSGTNPGYGGWYFATGTAASRQLICIFTMKIPVGRKINWHSNSIGTNGTSGWLTKNEGTGQYETYAYYVNSGNTGSFSSTMFFAIDNNGDSSTFYTYLASATVYNVTQSDYDSFRNVSSNYITSSSLYVPNYINTTSTYYDIGSSSKTTRIYGTSIWNYSSSNMLFDWPYGTLTCGLFFDFGRKNASAGFPQTTVRIKAPAGSSASSWPSGWGGGLATWDIICASIQGNIVNTSDARLKEQVVTINSAIDTIMKFRPVSFYWIKEYNSSLTNQQFGFIAQEVEKIMPELVIPGSYDEEKQEEGNRSLNYIGIIPFLTKAIQEQQEIIGTQQKRIDSLEERLKVLEDLLK